MGGYDVFMSELSRDVFSFGTPENVDFHYLDLLNYRPISAEIASFFQVHHESPQLLLIKDGECIYDESHYGIMMDELKSFL